MVCDEKMDLVVLDFLKCLILIGGILFFIVNVVDIVRSFVFVLFVVVVVVGG